MTIKQMKRIDQSIGMFVCTVLAFWRWGWERVFGQKPPPSPVKTIVVLKFLGMGSILLTTPALRAIRKTFPNVRLVFWTFSSNREVCASLGLIDEIVEIRVSSIGVFLMDVLRGLYCIRQMRPDIAIDMEFLSKFSAITTYLTGAAVRAGYYVYTIWRGNLLTMNVPYNHYKHVTEAFQALTMAVGAEFEPDLRLTPPVLSDQQRTTAQVWLTQQGIGDTHPLIVMNVNASDLSFERRWPSENFIQLTQWLIERYQVRMVFIGGSSERGYVEEILKFLPPTRVMNVAGETNLSQLIALLQRATLFIGNDSGPLHLAVSVGLPTVSFFGPEIPLLYGPLGEQHLVFYKGIACSPCLTIYNGKTWHCTINQLCLRMVTVDEVIQGISQRYHELLAT